jgi:hypothetical protein
MTPLEKFLHDVGEIHSSRAAVDETPYYGSLEVLLNEIGKTLKPRVRCIIHPKNKGAGLPDGGLFTAEQFDKQSGEQPKGGQLPSRGAMEVKAPSESAVKVALSEQVTRYVTRYRQVLVTNLREFVLVGIDLDGRPAILEKYELASSEGDFWKMTVRPRMFGDAHSLRLMEYLRRVMVHAAPLTAPEDVAFFLASYARDALARIERVDLEALAAVRLALEEALGLKFEGEKGEHFFRSSLIQTLFYGVFSAWVLWARNHPPTSKDRFDWNSTARLLKVPVIRKLFYEVAEPGQLENLKLNEVLDWTAAVLNRVDRAQFFAKFQESHAVQYFYEPFLEEFDPELRKQLGVWYTPHEIVEYMVARVDTALRQELGLADGLADRNVYVLDPCCGTGSFLVEVLRKIHETLKSRGEDALVASDLKEAAKNRVFGFEILPAPFVVSHLQIGLLLDKLGAAFSEKGNERAGVYLTNALTGWEPPKGPKKQLTFAEFGEERDAAEKIKRNSPILVVIGNPPYNAFAGVSTVKEEIDSIAPYKEGLVKDWGIKKFNLDDLYVRFFRLAEHRIAEMTGRGVVCYISNFSYLGDPSFVVLRNRFVTEFSKLWFDCMNGDSRETGKVTPDGKPDPSVFSTERNPAGIRVGTTIGLLIRNYKVSGEPTVKFRDFWGGSKRSELLESLKVKNFDAQYGNSIPGKYNRYSFRPSDVASEYRKWPRASELCALAPQNGLMEKRGGALIDIDRERLEARMKMYFDPKVEWGALIALRTALTQNATGYEPEKTRIKLCRVAKFETDNVVPYSVRPFDNRWCYYSAVNPLWNRARPQLWGQAWKGNSFLLTRPAGVASPEGPPMFFTRSLGDNDSLRGHAYYIPLRVRAIEAKLARKDERQQMFGRAAKEPAKATEDGNLSDAATSYLAKIGVPATKSDIGSAEMVFMHILAIGYSPQYLLENADGVRQDWPRVPLPFTKDLLVSSARIGGQIADLLDTDRPVAGITTGGVRRELELLAVTSRVRGGSLTESELAVTAGWSHKNKEGATMPGKGRAIERNYAKPEEDAISAGAKIFGLSSEQAFAMLGAKTSDIYLNDLAYWANVPVKVWEYTIGGYQVIKKWLSYREQKLLGRPLTKGEVRYVQEMVRRIAAILLLQPTLDANYKAAKSNTFPWVS